jgi:hypothetical protein
MLTNFMRGIQCICISTTGIRSTFLAMLEAVDQMKHNIIHFCIDTNYTSGFTVIVLRWYNI